MSTEIAQAYAELIRQIAQPHGEVSVLSETLIAVTSPNNLFSHKVMHRLKDRGLEPRRKGLSLILDVPPPHFAANRLAYSDPVFAPGQLQALFGVDVGGRTFDVLVRLTDEDGRTTEHHGTVRSGYQIRALTTLLEQVLTNYHYVGSTGYPNSESRV